MLSNAENGAFEPIAVIGLAFQFPGGANTEDKFWELLMERRCVSREFPRDRFNIDLYHDPNQMSTSKVCENRFFFKVLTRLKDYPSQVATRNAHFLDNDIREFDPRFFSISQAEAGSMDPQHRALMETTYHALESGK
jgi:acyl transferase domain-containing protein